MINIDLSDDFNKTWLHPTGEPVKKFKKAATKNHIEDEHDMEHNCPCCGGSGEHQTGFECYGCDASGLSEDFVGTVPCEGREDSEFVAVVDGRYEHKNEVLDKIKNFNPNHDKSGRFAPGSSGYTSGGKKSTKYPGRKKGEAFSTYAERYMANNKEQATKDYQKRVMEEFDTNRPNVVSADDAKFVIPGFTPERSSDYHEPASGFVKDYYKTLLADNSTTGLPVLFTAGGTGAGKSTALRGNLEHGYDGYTAVYDGNMSGYASAVGKIDAARKTGRNVDIVFVDRDPVTAFKYGVIPRIAKEGRAITVKDHIQTHLDSRAVVPKIAEHYANDPGVTVRVIDNNGALGTAHEVPLANLTNNVYNKSSLREQLNGAAKEAYTSGQISEGVYRLIEDTSANTTDNNYNGSASSGKRPEEQEKVENFNPNHDKKGRFSEGGAGGSTSSDGRPTQTVLKGMAESARKNGGMTTDIKGNSPTEGIAFAPRKDTEAIISDGDFGEKTLDAFVDKHFETLKQDGMHIGGWFNSEDGNWYLDISKVGPYNKNTIQEAQDAEQLAVFDLKDFNEIKTGEFVDGKYKPVATAEAIFAQTYGGGDKGGVQGSTKEGNEADTKEEGELDKAENFNHEHDKHGRFAVGTAAQKETLASVENEIRSNSSETFHGVDTNGEVIATLTGNSKQVKVDFPTAMKLASSKNVILTHNHPSQGKINKTFPFSVDDLKTASMVNAKGIRAVGTTNNYSMSRKGDSWPAPSQITKQYNLGKKAAEKTLRPKVDSGELQNEEAQFEYYHLAMQSIADKFDLSYDRQEV